MDTSRHLRPSLMSSDSDASCALQSVILASQRQAYAHSVDQAASIYLRYAVSTTATSFLFSIQATSAFKSSYGSPPELRHLRMIIIGVLKTKPGCALLPASAVGSVIWVLKSSTRHNVRQMGVNMLSLVLVTTCVGSISGSIVSITWSHNLRA